MSKYGNLAAGPVDFTKEIYVVEEQFDKGLISQEEADKKIKKYKKLALKWITLSNDTSRFRAKAPKPKKGTISELKDAVYAEESLKFRDRLLKKEAQAEPEESTEQS